MSLEKINYIIEYILQSSTHNNSSTEIFVDHYIGVTKANERDLYTLLNQCNIQGLHQDVHLYRECFAYRMEWEQIILLSSSPDLLNYLQDNHKFYVFIMNYLYLTKTNDCLLRIRYHGKYVLVFVDNKKMYAKYKNNISVNRTSYKQLVDCTTYYSPTIREDISCTYNNCDIKLINSKDVSCHIQRFYTQDPSERLQLYCGTHILAPNIILYAPIYGQCVVLGQISNNMYILLCNHIAGIYQAIVSACRKTINLNKYLWEIKVGNECIYISFLNTHN